MVKKTTNQSTALIRVKLNDLIPWADNYNVGDIGAIALSIRKFGFNNVPRIWNGLNLRAGNHTALALVQIRHEGPKPALDRQFPPQHVYVEDGEWYIDCMDLGDLSDEEATAFAIADNRDAALASQDETALLKHLIRLSEQDEGLLLATGYDGDDMEALRKMLGQPIVGEDFNKTPHEALDFYLNGNIKQIVLYYDPATYLSVVERLTKVMMDNNLDSNTSTVIHLLDEYDKAKGISPHADALPEPQADQPESI